VVALDQHLDGITHRRNAFDGHGFASNQAHIEQAPSGCFFAANSDDGGPLTHTHIS
jgi:hypothetical protein